MVYIIAAVSRNGVIGNKGQIPWKIKGEQQRFKQLTTGNVVVMGRRTYEEIGKPLPDRLNIVISAIKNFTGENLITLPSLATALEKAVDRDVYISGGSRLYREALPLADKLFITEIEAEFEGDTFFPDFDKSLYRKEAVAHFDGEIPYSYVTYVKK